MYFYSYCYSYGGFFGFSVGRASRARYKVLAFGHSKKYFRIRHLDSSFLWKFGCTLTTKHACLQKLKKWGLRACGQCCQIWWFITNLATLERQKILFVYNLKHHLLLFWRLRLSIFGDFFGYFWKKAKYLFQTICEKCTRG